MVSIIIVNYNTCKLTSECINSIYEKVHSCKYEIIVVDNASVDNSAAAIKRKYPEVILITSRKNCKHSKKCTFYTLRFGCSFAAVNTIKPQLL